MHRLFYFIFLLSLYFNTLLYGWLQVFIPLIFSSIFVSCPKIYRDPLTSLSISFIHISKVALLTVFRARIVILMLPYLGEIKGRSKKSMIRSLPRESTVSLLVTVSFDPFLTREAKAQKETMLKTSTYYPLHNSLIIFMLRITELSCS